MHVALFIPCYMEAFEPEVGIATLELLERLGCEVEYPFDQTCCGQPMVNTGCHKEAAATEALYCRTFEGFDCIVCPSGSCVHQVRVNMTAVEQTEAVRAVRARTFELTEFLHDVLKVEGIEFVEPARPDDEGPRQVETLQISGMSAIARCPRRGEASGARFWVSVHRATTCFVHSCSVLSLPALLERGSLLRSWIFATDAARD